MKVDGGKSLTSRGQIDWYGHRYMTRKFENNSTSYIQYRMNKENTKPRPAFGDIEGLDDWCDEIQTSKWAVKSDDAHLKQSSMYMDVVEN